uniref:Uncharacterized protein n=1 Tax=Rhizophora mucronata TaxID=61149 RepID=A0A2P2QM38_RHIMU
MEQELGCVSWPEDDTKGC